MPPPTVWVTLRLWACIFFYILTLSAGYGQSLEQTIQAAKVAGPVSLPILDSLYFADERNKPLVFDVVYTIVARNPAYSNAAIGILKDALQSNFPTIRSQSAEALGMIGFAARKTIENLNRALHNGERPVKIAAAKALGKIAGKLQDGHHALSLPELRAAVHDLGQSVSITQSIFTTNEEDEQYTATIRRPYETLKLILKAREDSPWHSIVNNMDIRVWLTLGYVLLMLIFWNCVLLINPFLIVRFDSFLRTLAGSDASNRKARSLSLQNVVQCLTLGILFRYHPRVLNAWVYRYAPVAGQIYDRMISEHSIRISLPIRFDGVLFTGEGPEDLKKKFYESNNRWLIFGEGGVGKTNLALHLGKWLLKTEGHRRSKKAMLPVIIDGEIDAVHNRGRDALLDVIAGKLKYAIDQNERIDPDLLRQLLSRRKILVIVDSYSEMSVESQQLIKPMSSDFPVNCLIVTSRLENSLAEFNLLGTKVEPSKLEGAVLVNFIQTYIAQRDVPKRINPNDIIEYTTQLIQTKEVVRGREITVLFAKIFAEQILANASSGDKRGQILESLPEMMLRYLNEITKKNKLAVPDRDIYRITGLIAWECVKENFKPVAVYIENLQHTLSGSSSLFSPDEILDIMLNKLKLLKWDGDNHDRVRFILDPLAEYFSSYLLVRYSKEYISLLAYFNTKVDGQYAADEIKGFQSSLFESIDHYQPKFIDLERIHTQFERITKP